MTNYTVKDVDEFIDSSPELSRPHLRALRSIVLETLPGVEEGIHYGKPYYKFHGYLAGFDAYSKHIGFELWTDKLDSQDRELLEVMGYKTGSRTFQIRFNQEVPIDMIKRLISEQARINQAKARS